MNNNPLKRMIILYLGFFYPKSSSNNINIDVSNFSVSGDYLIDDHLIKDGEIKVFNLTLDAWKNAFESIVHNYYGLPSEIYYSNPTPYGNLFNQYDKPTRTTIRFLNSTIIEKNTTPEIVATQDCDNYRSNETLECKITLTAKRSHSIQTSWKQSFGFSTETGFNIGIDKLFGVSGKVVISNGFETSVNQEVNIELGTEVSASTKVDPGHGITALLISERGSCKMETVFQAKVDGKNLLYFPKANITYMGDPSVKGETSLIAKQIIDISMYSRAKIEVRDKISKKLIKTIKF